ncbi:ABC transporter permease [Aneurinibacillus thermoaerophilus]|uniref:ABC transporter permease n=1 Tax=Aneurinibacillus thermoaerophilus TaxID=143495 RepID=UPI002E22397A|nr:ABC transporter permease [Aneurinibacillus thermoaerophilus]MED0765803.1 ABC transporter permease [Aneurinibacillus thermoaerophilus]
MRYFNVIFDTWKSRKLILELAKKDMQMKYLGNYLGIFWAFVHPTIMILIFWFVFQVGFKSMPVDNFPFVLWLMAGIVPWFFFSDSLSSATNAITDNSFLVKKVVFRVGMLPIVKITSSLFIHLFFIVSLFLMFYFYDYDFSIYNIQVLYYLIATIAFVFSLSLITSSLIVFLKDIGQIVSMVLQFLFWLTPIFWSFEIVPTKYQLLLKLNPLYYIVEGYRYAFIYHEWFWQHKYLTVYFWSFTIITFIVGAILFKRLRPHFADVL